jgi:hypothetical protein
MTTEQQYSFSLVMFQPSLNDNMSAIPVAVIVLSGADKKLILIGQDLAQGKDDSELEQAIIGHLKDILRKQIEQALTSAESTDEFYAALAIQNRWNLFITPVQMESTGETVEMTALRLFGKFIRENTKQIPSRGKQRSAVKESSFFEIDAPMPV